MQNQMQISHDQSKTTQCIPTRAACPGFTNKGLISCCVRMPAGFPLNLLLLEAKKKKKNSPPSGLHPLLTSTYLLHREETESSQYLERSKIHCLYKLDLPRLRFMIGLQ